VLDQLKSGLCVMGVADAMATYPEVMEAFFVAGKQAPLSGGNQNKLLNCVSITINTLTLLCNLQNKSRTSLAKFISLRLAQMKEQRKKQLICYLWTFCRIVKVQCYYYVN